MGKISNPEPIHDSHQIQHFCSGENVLDDWLKQRALKNHRQGASRTFVVHENNHVIGFYCLSVGSVLREVTSGKIRRNMPNQIPVMILGRLAVDKHYQNQGVGVGLLKDAVLRTQKVAEDAGIRALLVHAMSISAKHFYKRFGFIESPLDDMTLMLALW